MSNKFYTASTRVILQLTQTKPLINAGLSRHLLLRSYQSIDARAQWKNLHGFISGASVLLLPPTFESELSESQGLP